VIVAAIAVVMAMIMVALLVPVAIVVVSVLLVPVVLVAAPIRALTFVRAVTRRIHLVIPTIRYEIDWPAASVIFVAVLRPMPLVSRRDVQVQRGRRWLTWSHRDGNRHHRSGKDQFGCWRNGHVAANRELAVQAGGGKVH
jgi:hypothetical protein